MNKFSFSEGYSQVKNKDLAIVKREIMEVLKIETRAAWSARLNGRVEPKVSEAEAINAVFAKYGIKKVWGE